MQRPMPYTLAEAAKATGTNKTTILRAIKSGKLSGTKDTHGEWQVEPVELHRVYPPAEPRSGALAANMAAAQQYAAVRAAALEAEIMGLKTTAELLKAQLDDTRQDRDHWRDQAQAVTRQLADARPRGGLFARLFAKAG
jgi:excisionase family DNA binding protein